MQANKQIAQGRLSLAEDMLVASGWREDRFGWSPPTQVASVLKRDLCLQQVGRYGLPDAMALQLKFDASICRLNAAA